MKRLLSLFISALMVFSCVALVPAYAADAPSIDDTYLLVESAYGNGMSKSAANALKGSNGFTYAEDIKITSVTSGAYLGVWIGKANGYVAGYNADTEELMIAKRKVGSAGGFDTSKVLGKTSFALAKDTAYSFELKISGNKAEILINGEVKLTIDDSNVGTPATLIVYHTGIDAQVDNFSLKNASGESVVSLDFAEEADFDDSGWEFTLDAGYSIPGVLDRPMPIDGEYFLEVDYGFNYMQTVVSPYDFTGFTYEIDVCPIDTTTDDEERRPTFAGVHYADFGASSYTMYFANYNFTRQRFELVKDSGLPYGNGGTVLAYADYKWEDYYTTDEYNWHKIGFRMVMGKFIITLDGAPVLEYEDKENVKAYVGKVIIGYTYGEFYLDNMKAAESLSYDCATGKGEVIASEDFNSGNLTSYNENWIVSTTGPYDVKQANTKTVCTSADKYSDTPSPDPEIVIEKNVLYSPQDAKYIDTAKFIQVNGTFTSVLDIAYIAPRSEGDALFGYWLGRNNKIFAGYNLASGGFVIAPWLGEEEGCDEANAYAVSEPFALETGKWYTVGVRSAGSIVEIYVNGECVLKADNADFANIPLDIPVKFYTLGEYYIDNWVLADSIFNLAENVGNVKYEMAFDTDSIGEIGTGILDTMVGYEVVKGVCKGADDKAKYDCNFKFVGEGGGVFVYTCCVCETTVAYDADGNVTEVPEAGIAGDANKDGKISAADAIVILQKLANFSVDIDEDLANVNTDELVNVTDAVMILRLLAQWPVELVYNGPSVELTIETETPAFTSYKEEDVGAGNPDPAYAMNLAKSNYAMKLEVAEGEYLQNIAFLSPSWGNALGGMTVSVYKWDSDYATTISGEKLCASTIVDYNDNARISFTLTNADDIAELTNGSYLIVFESAPGAEGISDVGLWRAATNGSGRAIEIFENGVTPENVYYPIATLTYAYAH